jgi:hypothetical protein
MRPFQTLEQTFQVDLRSFLISGFNGREVRGFEKDGYIVKVMGERKTIFGTAWYQLNHSTIRTNVKRPHACTWFGVCSYRS